MIISVKVIPKSSRNLVKEEKRDLKVYPHTNCNLAKSSNAVGVRVYLTKPAYDGLANEQLIILLADYFKVKKYQVRIARGDKSRNKLVEISDGRERYRNK